MIYLYSGTPGSGKSLHTIKDIVFKLQQGGNVISNFNIDVSKIKPKSKRKGLGKFVYKSNADLTVAFLMEFARTNHEKGKEGETLVVIDEAQALFNPRDFDRKDRRGFNYFFTIHRHLGYNFILVTQNDRLLDRQIRCLIEYEYKHRKVNNYGTIGLLLPFKFFCSIGYWYGNKVKVSKEFFTYKKKYSELYDSYTFFNELCN